MSNKPLRSATIQAPATTAPPTRHRRVEPSGLPAPTLGRRCLALLTAAALLFASISPAEAHRASREVGGTCAHSSASIHYDGPQGSYTVQMAADFRHNDRTCLRSLVKVRGLDMDGYRAGWDTSFHRGDPGVLASWAADDVMFTRHLVETQFDNGAVWQGITLWH